MNSKQQLFVKSARPAGSGARGQQGSGFIYSEAERGESQRLRGDSVQGFRGMAYKIFDWTMVELALDGSLWSGHPDFPLMKDKKFQVCGICVHELSGC